MGNKQSKQDSLQEASTAMPPPPTPGHPSRTNSIPKLDTDFLLQPPDESSIKRPWLQLNNLIDSHVQTFYSNINDIDFVASREKIQEALRRSGIVEGTKEVDNLSELLYIAEHRKLGLRICIARAILASIDFQNGRYETTSLDSQVVELLSRFKTLRPDRSPEEEAALAHWRMITAFFLAPESKHSRADSAGEIPCVDILINFLGPFKRYSDAGRPEGLENATDGFNTDQDWEGSIRTIAVQAIGIGEKLFCHPSTWTFRWCPHRKEPPRELTTQIVLFPALVEDVLSSSSSSSRRRHNTIQPADISPAFVFTPTGAIIPAPEQEPDPVAPPASPSRSQGSTASRPASIVSGGGSGGSGGLRPSTNQVTLNRSTRRSYFEPDGPVQVHGNHYVSVYGDSMTPGATISGADVNIVVLPRRPSASRTGSGTLVSPVVYDTRRPIIISQSPDSHSRRSRRPHSASRVLYPGEDADDIGPPRRRDSANRNRSTT
ncbi:hypothetical protein B0T21DRAFT_280738 [Apiosordaria backusii]|uniref:Uncharacterized protein n=1 Tax=Apiosordaria backusii TaxID=314023 RepID=A0AA40K3L6_9PEZI|nr:hypothetical protein B0T21DRAFT_280738 [Apiosordaria backusii]